MRALIPMILVVLAAVLPPHVVWRWPVGQGSIVVPIGACVWLSLIASVVLAVMKSRL